MPKIQNIPTHNDQSFQTPVLPSRTFTQQKNQSQNKYQKSIPDSVVPIHEVSYDPQFSKSPLASLEMNKNPHIQTVENYPQDTLYYDFEQKTTNRQEANSKIQCKTVLCWMLAVLGIAGLIVGLYFVVDAILSHKSPSSSTQVASGIFEVSSGGIIPVLVNPVSYDRIQSSSRQTASTSPSKYYQNPNTYPSALPRDQKNLDRIDQQFSLPVKNISTQKKTQIKYQPESQFQSQSSQTQSQTYIDPYQNSIQPINVYQSKLV